MAPTTNPPTLYKNIGCINRGYLELETCNGHIIHNQQVPVICKNKIYISIKAVSN